MDALAYILIAFFLTKIPLIGTYVRLVNTIVHEISHIIIAKITGGKGYRIALNRDTSGHALIGSSSKIGTIITAYAGYTGSSVMAFLLFFLLYKGLYMVVLSLFLGMLIIATLLWVRNLFGFLWSVSFVALLWALLDQQQTESMRHISYMLSSVVLVESVASAGHIMMLSFKHPNHAGDATSLQKSTFIPALFWGVLFFVQSMYVGYKIVNDFVI